MTAPPASANATSTSVAICALTYKRPEGIARLVRAINELTFRATPPEIRIVIVDNDPQGSARKTCEALKAASRWLILYTIEPQPGIVYARNTAMAHAKGAEWICFIDDDEVPDPRWLDELIRTQRACDADVVGGPVIRETTQPLSIWLRKGNFFQSRRYRTGQRIPYAFTGNVLFRASIPAKLNLRFDPRWALTGGEDRQFFACISLEGYKIVWSNEAVATELVPESRQRVRWVLQRAFRYGNAHSSIELDLTPRLRTHARLLAVGGYRIAKGLIFLPLTWPFGLHNVVVYLRHICYGAGILSGWYGMRYEEYGKEADT